MRNILITSMGSTGSLNLTEMLRRGDRRGAYRIIGTNSCPYEMARSDLDDLFMVPDPSQSEAYVDAHVELIEALGIDLLIANRDREVRNFSEYRKKISCTHFIPDFAQVSVVQDKLALNQVLRRHGCAVAPNAVISSIAAVRDAFAELPPSEQYWIRPRRGDGARGAACITTPEQAIAWIGLWASLNNGDAADFVLAPFLPGRDIGVALLFQDGEFCVGKAYQKVQYLHGEYSMSGVGPTMRTGTTVCEREPVDAGIKVVQAVGKEFGVRPHGLYYCDTKCDVHGAPLVTEINIGRFPMTTAQYDRMGQYDMFELYLSLAFEPEQRLVRNVYDFDPGKFVVRGVDHPLRVVGTDRIEELRHRVFVRSP